MTPEMYEMWDKHNNSLREVSCVLTPEQEAEWLARNAMDTMSTIANHSNRDAVVKRNIKKKKNSVTADSKKYGILYAESKKKKIATSKRWKQRKLRSRNARSLKKLIPTWAKAREGASKKYRTIKHIKIVLEGE